MKRTSKLVAMMLILVLILTGCGGQTSGDNSANVVGGNSEVSGSEQSGMADSSEEAQESDSIVESSAQSGENEGEIPAKTQKKV